MARVPWLAAAIARRAQRDPEAAAARSIPDPVLRAKTLHDPVAGPLLLALQASTVERLAERLPGTRNDIAQSSRPFDYPLERLAAPVLVVHGSADPIAPFAAAERLVARAPRAELLATPGGHVTLFTHLHDIQPRVREFLSVHPAEVVGIN
jgi:pimeloyl-ACP methyl ester carboxylesterase